MKPDNLLNCRDRAEFRRWLEAHHAAEPECWVAVRRGKPEGDETFWYLDAVEEALCFGWIDSTQKRLPDGRIAQRFTPRKRGSHWTELKAPPHRTAARQAMPFPSSALANLLTCIQQACEICKHI